MDLTTTCPDCGSVSKEIKRTKDINPLVERIYYVCTNENCTRHHPEEGFVRRAAKIVRN
jgi:hypothetical protein